MCIVSEFEQWGEMSDARASTLLSDASSDSCLHFRPLTHGSGWGVMSPVSGPPPTTPLFSLRLNVYWDKMVALLSTRLTVIAKCGDLTLNPFTNGECHHQMPCVTTNTTTKWSAISKSVQRQQWYHFGLYCLGHTFSNNYAAHLMTQLPCNPVQAECQWINE